jgi:hypothetical protein
MAALVREHDLGVVANGFDRASVRAALAGLNPVAVERWRVNARAARALLSAENEAATLRSVVQDVLVTGH